MKKFILVTLALVLIASQAMKNRDSSQLGSGNPPDDDTVAQVRATLKEYSDELNACDPGLYEEISAQLTQIKDNSGKSTRR